MDSFVIPANKDEKTLEGDYTHVHEGKILATVAGRVKNTKKSDTEISSITRRFARCDVVALGDRPLAGTFRGMIRREDIRATQRDRAEPALSFRPGDLVRARVVNVVGSTSCGYASTSLPDAAQCCPEVGSVVTSARAVAASVLSSSCVTSATVSGATYLLSTAEPELGVVVGIGRPPLSGTTAIYGATGGCPLLPASWTEMVCPRTMARFPRKVARVPDDLLNVLASSTLPQPLTSS
ncbi:unnamed protein product [Mesocestoides corti]|uniref:Exosome complex component CSL4 C-terminal domain-containing protein n=1 Tax=Mesocestoides corti TaxID=53468 RepID=A0A0R3U8F0_MESCO|nr:unnamed protein product [Mesocestoides corti]